MCLFSVLLFFSLYFRLISWSKRYNIETLVAIVCMYTLYYYTCNVVHKQCISYGFSGEIKNFIDYNTHEMCVCAHKNGITSEHTHRIHLYIYMQAIVSLSAFEFNGSGGQAKKEWWFGLIALLNIRHSRERSIWLANPSSNTTGRMRNIWLHREVFTHYYTLLPNGLSFSLSLHHSPVCNVHVSRFPKMATPNLLQYIYIYNINSLMCGQVNKTTENKNRRKQYNSTLLYENENNKQSREKRKIVAQPQYKMNTASRTTPKTTSSSSHHIEGVSARAHCAAEFIDPVAKKKNHKHKHRSVTIASTLTALFYYFSLWWEHTYTRTRPT